MPLENCQVKEKALFLSYAYNETKGAFMKPKMIAAGLLSASLLLGALPIYGKESSPATETAPAVYDTLAQMKENLTGFKDLDTLSFDPYKEEKEEGTFVIPGLNGTASLRYSKTLGECTEMTPQGITATDDYLIISAYCHQHQHYSVLYVLDKDSHEYIKTVVLDGMPHAGSIAYDPDHDVLWVATALHGHAAASSILMDDIEQYDDPSKAISWNSQQELEDLDKDSFLTWHDGYLIAGTYDADADSKVNTYDIDGKGKLIKKSEDKPTASDQIAKNMQGYAQNDSYILTSASDGPHLDSTLAVFDADQTSFLDEEALKTWTLPCRMEQIWIDGNTVYVLFESAAKAYRDESTDIVDRVLSFDLEKAVKDS
jgi:hypothetical protein